VLPYFSKKKLFFVLNRKIWIVMVLETVHTITALWSLLLLLAAL